MTAEIIDGKAFAAGLRARVAELVPAFREKAGRAPGLAVVLVGEDPASAVYVRSKGKQTREAGMESFEHKLGADTTQATLIALVDKLNADPEVDGILVQLPLPDHIDEQAVLTRIDPDKDVDGFHPENVGLIAQGRPRFLPCTPHGIQQLLIRTGVETSGAHLVVLGRSDIVGKPMGLLMVQKAEGANATVTFCHSRTRNLAEIAATADILVAAIGRPNFVTAEMVKPGAVVIDVGINRVDDKLVGDVDFDPVSEIAGAITPVPGGVGPMTIAMLLKNTLAAARGLHAAASD